MLDAYTATEIVRARQIHAVEGPRGTLWNGSARYRDGLPNSPVLLTDEDRVRFLEQAREEIRCLHAN
ncbi:hypothetical protein NS228_05590 [Methylobacterium indicum]|jgi:hypothetical protein|uniref:Uncharacterized protein n=3 Tax=Methylobacterium TaxID=407 RepID=A0A0J6RB51_9HYPH|nr:MULTISPECIES: hypothetical protein [Methylobacterium]KMO18502.1 hypothetical protein QR79_20180 [Methylobacterium indicum]KMO20457.1 hypothetical protein QR78_10825 [Methylobacterium indicum]KTS19442.1 hypothetical protein NS229_25625 [Methylobacterium indicum]KTS41651.1 hypothetical protein NS228_05590 [Methylobacterium indicum]KTS45815.1 hypothetical protein NS230_23215 [Methylobacterium indicum]